MKETIKFLNNYGVGIILLFVLIIFLRGCGVNSDKEYADEVINKKLDSLTYVINITNTKLDSVNSELKTEMKVEGLKTEKRTLINTNQIFLTNKRPDTRFLEIDKEIEKLEN